jgi:hypothetical protein
MSYEEVHPPVDESIVTRFPSDKMLLHEADDPETYIQGRYVNLDNMR